jgi:hypothetical protein
MPIVVVEDGKLQAFALTKGVKMHKSSSGRLAAPAKLA